MSKFLNRFQLTEELQRIICDASEYLILISPYFKLNEWTKRSLANHISDKKFHLIVVYGKNEDNKFKSMSDDDMNFFKLFCNVQISYHKRLHAKIYANEKNCLLTSMNLHEFSMNENIEFGILTQSKMLDSFLSDSLDKKASEFRDYIITKSHLEFKKEVQKEKSFFGLFNKYGDAIVQKEENRYGYCLRSGKMIPYNLRHPYSIEAFQSWNRYKNPDYHENYCHACGGIFKTSKREPLCSICDVKK